MERREDFRENSFKIQNRTTRASEERNVEVAKTGDEIPGDDANRARRNSKKRGYPISRGEKAMLPIETR